MNLFSPTIWIFSILVKLWAIRVVRWRSELYTHWIASGTDDPNIILNEKKQSFCGPEYTFLNKKYSENMSGQLNARYLKSFCLLMFSGNGKWLEWTGNWMKVVSGGETSFFLDCWFLNHLNLTEISELVALKEIPIPNCLMPVWTRENPSWSYLERTELLMDFKNE